MRLYDKIYIKYIIKAVYDLMITNLLVNAFIKNNNDIQNDKVRNSYGTLSGVVGIIINVFLSLAKIAVGFLSGSISIAADGFNNLSDAASSVITLVGFKMSDKPADKDHPYGHQRMEYIAGFVIAVIILILGFELVKSSIGSIINPQKYRFNIYMIIILSVSVILKLWMFFFNRKLSRKINSKTIEATSVDSRNDVFTTLGVLLAVFVGQFTNIPLDGIMGALVGIFILISGINLIRETADPLLGTIPEKELTNMVVGKVLSYDGIIGTHDLMIHSYGPNKYFASVHAEVDAKEDITKSHDIVDNIERYFAENTNINLTIHMDPVSVGDAEVEVLKAKVSEILQEINADLTFHDFRLVKGVTHSNIIFDVAVPFECKMTNEEIKNSIEEKVKAYDSRLFCVLTFDKIYT